MSPATRRFSYHSSHAHQTGRVINDDAINNQASHTRLRSRLTYNGGDGNGNRSLEKISSCCTKGIVLDKIPGNAEAFGCCNNNHTGLRDTQHMTQKHTPFSQCRPNGTPCEMKNDRDKACKEIGLSLISRVKEFFSLKRTEAWTWARPSQCVMYVPNNQNHPVCMRNKDEIEKETVQFDFPTLDKNVNPGLDRVSVSLVDHPGNAKTSEDSEASLSTHHSTHYLSNNTWSGHVNTALKCKKSGDIDFDTSSLQCSDSNLQDALDTTPISSVCSSDFYPPFGWSKDFTANASSSRALRSSNSSSRQLTLYRYGMPYVESTADRLVGLTLHCVILSLAVMAAVLARWASRILRFGFYLALHSAVYKGSILPLREDSNEPVTREQLEDATMFDSAGLKIVLLQCHPPRRSAIEYSSNSSRLDSADPSTDTAVATSTYNKKSAITTTTNNYHQATASLHRSMSSHSRSSQDLSHIFSVSSS
ncbi:hypothetical protein ElyMa_002797200 [Elysia marginata]|uniref:Uncharacterized protein n=1 Tax=Elysia marginata TaxID=1093978 RepID=A0AAV4HPM1_9GAST|nr:hypothetical protein ElyMa_002797200 [Elysia marginata]